VASIQIDLAFLNDSLLIVDCLAEDEMQTASRLLNSLWDLKDTLPPMSARLQRVSNIQELFRTLQAVNEMCKNGKFPILHIEGHGDKEHGLAVGAAGQYVSWQAVADQLRDINKSCRNNLGVVLGACHGIQLANELSVVNPAPFHFLLSCRQHVTAGEVERVFIEFYRKLFESMSVAKARSTLTSAFDLVLAHEYFIIQLARHYKSALVGRGQSGAIEGTLSDLAKHEIARQYLGIKKIRSIAKTTHRPTEQRFEDQCRRFFHGETPIPYVQFMTFVQELTPPQR
jgi:hypothetical protein